MTLGSSGGPPHVAGAAGKTSQPPISSGGASAGDGGEGADVGEGGTPGASGTLGGKAGTSGSGGHAGTPDEPQAGAGGEAPTRCDSTRVVTGDVDIDAATIESFRGVGIIDGNLSVAESIDLRPLECLSTVIGTVRTGRANTLDGLQHLVAIGGDLIVARALDRVDELEGLRLIGGSLIANDTSLRNLDGFRNVRTIGGDLELSGNLSLATIDGFDSLVSIGGSLTIGVYCLAPQYCLTSHELRSLRGFPLLERVEGDLQLHTTSIETVEAFQGLTTVGGQLRIAGNGDLSSLAGFQNLVQVGELAVTDHGFWVDNDTGDEDEPTEVFVSYYNYDLENLDGLSALQAITGPLVIASNPALRSLRGLANVQRVDSVSIHENTLIPTCETEWLLESLGPTNVLEGTISISDTDDLGTCPPP